MPLTGRHNHPMVLADPYQVYRKYGGSWTCDGCGCSGNKKTLMFHCPECNFDLCSACFCFLEELHPDHPHLFKLVCRDETGRQDIQRCSECGSSLQFAHVCASCKEPSFMLCTSCFNGFHGLLMVTMFNLMFWNHGCFFERVTVNGHEHRLVLAPCEEVYPEHHGQWHCDGCGKNGKDKSQMFHCFTCSDYDLCSECAFSRAHISPLFDDDDSSVSDADDHDVADIHISI